MYGISKRGFDGASDLLISRVTGGHYGGEEGCCNVEWSCILTRLAPLDARSGEELKDMQHEWRELVMSEIKIGYSGDETQATMPDELDGKGSIVGASGRIESQQSSWDAQRGDESNDGPSGLIR
ncbi:hypothetical protein RhiLY_06726 [Ceratobasidium sp. AG-Ba]|nr:hypothetical protein RhiLY_06726 [Ceratobasidium sp. AG-Ba]